MSGVPADNASGVLATPIQNAGRGSAWRLDINGQSSVLRQYRRGGLMGRFNRDLYLWTGAQSTRPYREWMVMHRAARLGLRVPTPMAAMVCRVAGLFYRASILTPWVAHVGNLAAVSSDHVWFGAGVAIARLHAAGIWHADLNVHNILIDPQNETWIIDFDRAREGVTDAKALEDNLSRLKRSVDKVCPDLGRRHWSVLREGYARV